MNPWGLLFIAIGLLMIVVGFKGSQHSVMDAFKGVSPGGKSKKKKDKNNPDNIPPIMQNPKLA